MNRTSKMNYELVIFDLDGTLLNTSQGIYNSVRYAEKQLDLPAIEDSLLPIFVGPPPAQMYQKLYGLTEREALRAAQYHREYSRKYGIYEAEIYEGMKEVLEGLKERGLKTAVATLKSQEIAEKILEHFDLRDYFDVIIGMDKEESLTKADTIQMSREAVGSRGKAVLIGDSRYDQEGAAEAGIDFIGVLYGFGFQSEEELRGKRYVYRVDQLKDMGI